MLIRYFLAWFGLMILAVLNGGFRELVLKSAIGPRAAHLASTALLLLLIAVYLYFLIRRWSIRSIGKAWMIGVMWLLMTLAFETIMGRCINGHPWPVVFADYDITSGRMWVLIPLWTLFAPVLYFKSGIGKSRLRA